MMWTLTMLAAPQVAISWYLIPLSVVISLVYSASRYELPERVLRRAMRMFLSILFFMGIVFVILLSLSFRL